MTAVTSTWSSGDPGPLGICVADNFMSQQEIENFNKAHIGECYVFRSNSTTHFMNGDCFLQLLHGLVTPALAKQRMRFGLASNTRGLLLCDAWTGFHSWKGGLDTARAAWSEQAHCDLPALQVRAPENHAWSCIFEGLFFKQFWSRQ